MEYFEQGFAPGESWPTKGWQRVHHADRLKAPDKAHQEIAPDKETSALPRTCCSEGTQTRRGTSRNAGRPARLGCNGSHFSP